MSTSPTPAPGPAPTSRRCTSPTRLLPANRPCSPGTTISHAGLSFTWPGAAAGTPDNTLAAGQPVRLTGTGNTLGFLLAGSYGPVSRTGTVLYSDGTSQPFTLTAPDWYSTSATGDVAITTGYRNRPGNTQQTHTIKVFYAGVSLQAGKAVSAVVLPNVGTTLVSGTPLMHVFAMTLG